MPRINRRRRASKVHTGALTLSRREHLVYGCVMLGDDQQPFASEAEERATWLLHRESLLAEHRPGERPAGFYIHDLHIPRPLHWWQELEILLKHELLSGEEIIAVENLHPELSPSQSANFLSGYDKPGVDGRRMDQHSLEQLLGEFSFAAEWHKQRGRPELSARYQRRAEVIFKVLAGAP